MYVHPIYVPNDAFEMGWHVLHIKACNTAADIQLKQFLMKPLENHRSELRMPLVQDLKSSTEY